MQVEDPDAKPQPDDAPPGTGEVEEQLDFADLPVPTLEELRAALGWAFQGEDAPSEFLDRCAAHAHHVQAANRRMNLTAIVEPREIAAKHYLDAWRMTRLLPLLGRSVLDVGSGAGYPGIPLALAEPQAKVVMIDSTKKKADYVAESIRDLGIPNAFAEWGRAEEHLLRSRYDLVVFRAVSSVRENVRMLRKVRHSFRNLIMMKGPSWSREVRAAEREAERLGFHLDTVWEHKLPGELGDRAVLVYRAPGGR
jgi:16S rRNA (guanine527-N7)-methyltransferase